ncbi:MAG: hypothetical protein H6810_11650 [Phycisphaeraceae bacterium]|nr:MAG: hypothetical protein H6810_11650 [Phycisphaeraceae bacterium]
MQMPTWARPVRPSTVGLLFAAGLTLSIWTPAAAQDGGEMPDPADIAKQLEKMLGTVVADDAGQGSPMATEPDPGAELQPEPLADPEAGDGTAGAPPAENSVFGGEVTVDEYDLVDLHVNNESLSSVLQLLSLQSRRNIVASKAVSASITADLYGVTFYEALDAILHVNGFGYREQGNFIYVYTTAELEQIAQASRLMTTKVIELNYLNAVDAARFVSPLLSEKGTITTPNESEDFDLPDSGPAGKDNYANSALLVIHDFDENIAEITELVAELDTRPSQVLVEATILQAAINEDNAFGVDFSLIGDLQFTQFLNPLQAANGLISGRGNSLVNGVEVPTDFPGADGEARALTTNIGNVAGSGGMKVGIIDQDVAVFMRVLDEVTDVTVISNPKVLTLNRQAARVLVGTRVGFLNTTTTETSTTQSVEFLDTGTQLHIRPFVTSDDMIRLEVKPQVSTAKLRESTTSSNQAVTIPDEDTTELVTNLLVRDGQTVVLGGLFTESTSYTRRQVPIIGDIPLIGSAFRGQDDSVRRNEIIFLLTPSVVDDQILTLEGERGTDYIEHARVGAREGLLPWSRERQVGKLLIDAEKQISEGNDKRALLTVERALALSPHSADALKLRARLAQKGVSWPSRSILDDIFRREPGVGLSENDGPPVGVPATPATAETADTTGATSDDTVATVPTDDGESE